MIFVGVDIGSSFIKGAILDAERMTIEGIARRPFPEPVTGLPPGHFEIEPRAVVAAVESLLGELLSAAPRCEGILFCGQMGGVILADTAGEPLTNYISWRDQRTTIPHRPGEPACLDALSARLSPREIGQLGRELRAGSAISLLFWLAENGRLPPHAVPLSLGDHVLMRLCGSEPFTEFTQALGTLNLETRDWHHAAFDTLGLGGLSWPGLCSVWQPVGSFRTATSTIPCYPVIGDQQAALAGALLSDGELSINVSTGSQVSLLTPTLAIGNYQTRPYFDGRYLNTITHLPAGRSLDVLLRLLTELAEAQGTPLDNPWPVVSRLADAAAGDDGTDALAVDLAFFAGPMGDRGSISNISTGNLTVGRLFRAAFRNMAANYAQAAARLSPQRDRQRVVFSGGLAQRLDLLRRLILERVGGSARVCPSAEDTLYGMLVLSLTLCGRAGNLEDVSRIVLAQAATSEGSQP